MTGSVIVVGSITADVTTFSARLPQRGETILGDDLTLVLGGKGANQALAAARAGAPTSLVGCVGDDVFRDLVVGGLTEAGVGIAHVTEVPGPTGVAHIRVDATGENDIVIVPLANNSLTPSIAAQAVTELGPDASVLLVQLEIPRETAVEALRAGREAGLTTVLDPAPAADLPAETWGLVDVVTPNETEATILTGIPVDGRDAAIRAGQWFLDRGTRCALITLASAGAVLVTAEGVRDFAPFAVDAVDTTAAGDAFAGHLGAALAAGLPLDDAVVRASAAGALAVTRRGASPSLPTGTEVDALIGANRA